MNDWRKDLGNKWNANKIEQKSNDKLQVLQDKIRSLVVRGDLRQAADLLERERLLSDRETQKYFWQNPIIKELSLLITKKEEDRRKREQKRAQENEPSWGDWGSLIRSQISESEPKAKQFSGFTPIRLEGAWKEGWALGWYKITYNEFTKVGEPLHRLKYWTDQTHNKVLEQVDELKNHVVEFINTQWKEQKPSFAAIIPTPPSLNRKFQHVTEIAKRVGHDLGIPVDDKYLIKTKTTEAMKNLSKADRETTLADAFRVTDNKCAGKRVVLFDDLFGSGSTLNAITKALYEQGKIEEVYVLTLTKNKFSKG